MVSVWGRWSNMWQIAITNSTALAANGSWSQVTNHRTKITSIVSLSLSLSVCLSLSSFFIDLFVPPPPPHQALWRLRLLRLLLRSQYMVENTKTKSKTNVKEGKGGLLLGELWRILNPKDFWRNRHADRRPPFSALWTALRQNIPLHYSNYCDCLLEQNRGDHFFISAIFCLHTSHRQTDRQTDTHTRARAHARTHARTHAHTPVSYTHLTLPTNHRV